MLLAVTLAACSNSGSNSGTVETLAKIIQVTEASSADVSTENSIDDKGIYNRHKLDKTAGDFAAALNTHDISLLKQLTDQTMQDRFSDYNLKTALTAYKAFFRDQHIEKYEFVGFDSLAADTAAYRFFNSDGRYRDINFRYDQSSGYICTDSFLYYSGFASMLMESFIDALKDEDPVALKGTLTEDDLEYPASKVKEIVANYKKGFDLNTLRFSFTGNLANDGGFIYEISGKKDGIEAVHELEVIYGDGLVALRDDWIP